VIVEGKLRHLVKIRADKRTPQISKGRGTDGVPGAGSQDPVCKDLGARVPRVAVKILVLPPLVEDSARGRCSLAVKDYTHYQYSEKSGVPT